jgi:branched-chain amino acid transport system permease protein
VLGGGAGYLLGLPCLRLRGDYLAIVTLGFGEAFLQLIRNVPATGADQGIILQPRAIFRPELGLDKHQTAYVITALMLFLAVFLVERVHRSPVGRAWIAIRENEVAAASVGVPVVQMKLLAFSLSAAIAAVAGVLYGAKDGFVSPALGEFQLSIMVLAMVILGGLGNSYGALLGAALLYLVPEYLKLLPSTIQQTPALNAAVPSFMTDALGNLSDYRFLLFGAVMVIMMLYRPQGLLGSSRRKEEMLHR